MSQLTGKPGSPPTPNTPPSSGSSFGLPQSTALVMGSIIGVGIFSLPYAIAAVRADQPGGHGAGHRRRGRAGVRCSLSSRDGCRLTAAPTPTRAQPSATVSGFSQAWLYWITAWAGNAAIVVGWVFYVEKFVNKGGSTAGRSSSPSSVCGSRPPSTSPASATWASSRSGRTVLKFIPLALMATVGLFFIERRQLHALEHQRRHQPLRHRWRDGDLPVQLPGRRDRRGRSRARSATPSATCPRSTIFGTLASAVVYMLSLIAVFGILPASALASDSNQASYSAAADAISGGSWAGYLVALAVVISGIGALNGWTMICAEMPLAAAKDGLFPQRFGSLSSRGVPAFGIISSTALASVAVVISYLGSSGATVFTTLVLMTGITAAIPYAVLRTGPAQVAHAATTRRGPPPHFALDVGRRPGRAGHVAGLRLVLPQQRSQLVRRVGTVPDGRRRRPPRHPGLPLAAQHDDRTRPRARHTSETRNDMTFHVDSEVGQLQAGDRAPARDRAGPPHPGQRRRAPVRRRDVGASSPRGARRLRRAARGPGRGGPPLRRRFSPRRSTSQGHVCSCRTGSPPRPGSGPRSTSRSTTWSPSTPGGTCWPSCSSAAC